MHATQSQSRLRPSYPPVLSASSPAPASVTSQEPVGGVRGVGLSDRQAVIALLAADGHPAPDIAETLKIPLRTVEGHLYQALIILGVASVQHLTHPVIAAHTRPTPEQDERLSDGDLRYAFAARDATRQAPPVCDIKALHEMEQAQQGRASGDTAVLIAELRRVFELLQQERSTVEHLHKALHSRDVIGQAKGILMERHRIDADAAFAILQHHSSHTHHKLVDVAADLAHTGEH